MKATPLKPNPPFAVILIVVGSGSHFLCETPLSGMLISLLIVFSSLPVLLLRSLGRFHRHPFEWKTWTTLDWWLYYPATEPPGQPYRPPTKLLLSVKFKTRRIGANPEKAHLVNFRGPDSRKFSELCVLLFLLGKIDRMFPKSRFSKRIFGDTAGSTKLDRPHCKQFWQFQASVIFGHSRPFSANLGQKRQNRLEIGSSKGGLLNVSGCSRGKRVCGWKKGHNTRRPPESRPPFNSTPLFLTSWLLS